MSIRWLLLGCIFLAGGAAIANGDHDEERAKLNGTWRVEANDEAVVWSFDGLPDKLRLVETQKGEHVLETECDLAARAGCEGKDGGKRVKISMWFDGPKLVQLEVNGNDLIRRNFVVSEDGTTLEVRTVRPDGKAETVALKRPVAAADRVAASGR